MNPEKIMVERLQEMVDKTKEECGINCTGFMQLVGKYGWLGTVKYLLDKSRPSQGLLTMLDPKVNRPDLTVEKIIQDPIFSGLFTKKQLAVAKSRVP